MNTGTFHRNTALEEDDYVDQELVYEAITADTARELIATGDVGYLDSGKKADQLERYRSDPNPLDASGILLADRDKADEARR